jgi:CRP/FNR family transcriptional regulator
MNIFNSSFCDQLEGEISSNIEVVSLKKNVILVNEGDTLSKIPVLKKGLIKVYKEDVDLGREVLLYYVKPNQTCMMSIISCLKNSKSVVCAKLEVDSEIILIPSDKIKQWNSTYSDFNKFVLEIFMERYFELMTIINELTFENLDFRIIKLLKLRSQNDTKKIVRLTHIEIAQIIGSTRVVVSRILKNLEYQNKIIIRRGEVELLDL